MFEMFELLFMNPSLINYTYKLYSSGTQHFELKIKYNNRLMSFFVVGFFFRPKFGEQLSSLFYCLMKYLYSQPLLCYTEFLVSVSWLNNIIESQKLFIF